MKLIEVLHLDTYETTKLKDFKGKEECQSVLKSLDDYIILANQTHIEEGNKTETYKQEIDIKLDWWKTQKCDCIWKEWGSWTPCSKTCGKGDNAGTRTRERTKDQEELNGGSCSKIKKEKGKCNQVCCRKFPNP